MRWSGLSNGTLLRRAASEFDVFLTVDRSIQHQQVPPPDLALITIYAPNNAVQTVLALAPDVLRALESIRRGDSVFVGSRPR
jgi:hypothetical protein